ncbi:glycosyltransferase [Priestia megaterium]|uniref:glycosyltransferase n=1 Tax=Priestia megaterium TaxID=1404 RepID=UPI001C43FE3B|nr:glycosyltransferase [Priestia megaterium]MBV6736455.1 glycosyltransferase [Priestia megaterium]MDR0127785.1 glycosyltransferase [Priestia megaterium]
MKIAIMVSGVTGRGGMETVISSVVNEFNISTNEDIKIFVMGGSDDKRWLDKIEKRNYEIINSKSSNKIAKYLESAVSTSTKLKKYNPDIILAADEKAIFYSKIMSRLMRKRPKVGSWIHFSLTSIKPLYKKIIASADFHLAISSGIREQLIELGINSKSKVHLIYNPINIGSIMLERPEIETHFVYVGRLIYNGQKRVNDLLQALSQVKGEWKLTIIGDGKDKDQLIEQAEALKINDKIIWGGWKEEPWKYINKASVLVLTSEYEGFGMVLVEAMSRGIPCISSDCPVGPSDIIHDNENGWLYPIGDLVTLSNLLNEIVNGSRVLPSKIQVKESVEKFDTKIFINNLNKILRSEI